ncbi:Uncharacterised protein [marine metagenome]
MVAGAQFACIDGTPVCLSREYFGEVGFLVLGWFDSEAVKKLLRFNGTYLADGVLSRASSVYSLYIS